MIGVTFIQQADGRWTVAVTAAALRVQGLIYLEAVQV
jgi:hypothetical protein